MMEIKQEDEFTYAVESSKKTGWYQVNIENKPTCTCHGYTQHNTSCKHIKGVLELTEVQKGGDYVLPKSKEGENSEPETEIESNGKKMVIPEKYILYLTFKKVATPFILFDGLMYLARREGFKKLFAELIQAPNMNNDNRAICSGYLLTNDGQEFKDIGDADITSVKNKSIHPHITRMAATRAKGRVLRTWLEVDMVCVEELADDKEEALIEGKIDSKQKVELKKLWGKFNLPDEKKIEIWTWTLNLSIGDGDYVIEKLKEFESFGYNDFVTLKDEVQSRDQKTTEV